MGAQSCECRNAAVASCIAVASACSPVQRCSSARVRLESSTPIVGGASDPGVVDMAGGAWGVVGGMVACGVPIAVRGAAKDEVAATLAGADGARPDDDGVTGVAAGAASGIMDAECQ